MDILTSFSIIILAASIHASFQLSISILTLLSGHTINRKKSHLNLVKLACALTFGSISAVVLLFCTACFLLNSFYNYQFFNLIWAVLIGLAIGTAFSVWAFYYRNPFSKNSNSQMWIPRGFADFLSSRAKKTSHSAEAFSLGVSGVLSEILFIFAPMIIAALVTIKLSPAYQFVAVVVYTTVANLPLYIVLCLISGGHSIAKIQIWRDSNKRFLQFISGAGLLVLAFLVWANIFGVQR